MALNFPSKILVTNLHYAVDCLFSYNKSQNNLQTDIGMNQHLNNLEEKEVLFYLCLCPNN